MVALNLSNGERVAVAGITPGSASAISAFDCTRDGRLIAYSNIAADGRTSVVSFAGEGARIQSADVQGAIQGIAWSPGGERIAMTVIASPAPIWNFWK